MILKIDINKLVIVCDVTTQDTICWVTPTLNAPKHIMFLITHWQLL